jgi:hypothetical protein
MQAERILLRINQKKGLCTEEQHRTLKCIDNYVTYACTLHLTEKLALDDAAGAACDILVVDYSRR